KNGTWVGGKPLPAAGWKLREGDELRIGKTTVRFHAGRFVDAAPKAARLSKARPADPHEALSGTVTDFDLAKALSPKRRAIPHIRQLADNPAPRPIPPEPAAYARDEIYQMLTEIASSSWDSIYASASRPLPGGGSG